MTPRDIPDVKEAEDLLKGAESSFPSEQSAKDFKEAFQLLSDYIDIDRPDENVTTFVTNLKYSYARTILVRLNQIHDNDFDLFIHYIIVLFISAKSEFQDLRTSHPDIGETYDNCKERFKLQIRELVDEHGDA